MSALGLHVTNQNIRSSFVTVTSTPATFEEKYLFPEFDPLFRSSPTHHSSCARLADQIDPESKYFVLETPLGPQAIGICPNGDTKHYCFKEDEVLTWAIVDAMRCKGIAVSRQNFETIEIALDNAKDLEPDLRFNILKFLAAARALGKTKHFGIAALKKDPRKFAIRIENDVSSVFRIPKKRAATKPRAKKKKQ